MAEQLPPPPPPHQRFVFLDRKGRRIDNEECLVPFLRVLQEKDATITAHKQLIEELRLDVEELEGEIMELRDELDAVHKSTIAKDALELRVALMEGNPIVLAGATIQDLEISKQILMDGMHRHDLEISRRVAEMAAGSGNRFSLSSCPVCLNDDRMPDHCLGCGHLVCGECLPKLIDCPICRCHIECVQLVYGIQR